jgi:thiamine-phosphate pyrophosphorylase
MSLRNSPRVHPILCYVTDRRELRLPSTSAAYEPLLRLVESAAAAGIDWIQIREKDQSGRDCAVLVRDAMQRAAKSSSGSSRTPRVLVNDRLDVAIAERAGGVHLSENSLPVREAKRLVESRLPPADFLVGASCHSLDVTKSAASDGAHYVIFGPVFPTPSKVAYGPPQGLNALAEVCRSVSIPVLAIGGITLDNAASCLSAGAAGIAAIRLFQDATDIAAVVQALRSECRANFP